MLPDKRNQIYTYMRQNEMRQRGAQEQLAAAVHPRQRNIVIRHIRQVYCPTLAWLGRWLITSGERVQQYSNALNDLNVLPSNEATQSERNA